MKVIYGGHIPTVPITPSAIHHALIHLMENKAHANMHVSCYEPLSQDELVHGLVEQALHVRIRLIGGVDVIYILE